MPYTRRELWLLLAFAAVFLAGLGVSEWRAGFPELAERIEQFDRDDSVAPLPAPPPRESRPVRRPPRRADGGRPAGAATPSGRAAAEVGPNAEPDFRPLDLNTASVEQIARLPGVGASLARRIVAERERRGRFDSPEALRGVLGLGPKKLAALRELVTAGGASE